MRERESIYVWRRTERGRKKEWEKGCFLAKVVGGRCSRFFCQRRVAARARSRVALNRFARVPTSRHRRHHTVYDAVRCKTDADFIFKTSSLLRTYLSNGCLKHTSPENNNKKKE
ncbi:uncharacterized protein NPIL_679211 [Nephila pilipes]|uniref:Uncharacterized protein n=1 Tax=Nephila pilipes TaxID=299642 RepID=A0A8X6NLY2_NEPPI|nr:uncharacterized protein NPIL_679211 [Nephila pilipes]